MSTSEALLAGRRDRPGDERPFAGVPIAIKNNRPVDGHAPDVRLALFGDFVAADDRHVTRLREAGS